MGMRKGRRYAVLANGMLVMAFLGLTIEYWYVSVPMVLILGGLIAVGSCDQRWAGSRSSTVEPLSPADPAVLAAQQRLARRKEARALLSSDPALAAELRIGRPDLGRLYDDGGLVDINHVPAEVIARELEIPFPVAEEIVAQRTRVGGFLSTDDLVVYCQAVSPNQIAVAQDRLFFMPT